MTSGGARNRSGPPRDPNSGRSDRLGVEFTSLPNEGYRGRLPKFPLPKVRVFDEYLDEDKNKVRELDEDATEMRWERERALWRWAWRTPQAAAWAREPWRWHSVAMWVRTAYLCESAGASAADKNSLHRFADQIGLTPAGMAQNGWAVEAPVISPADPVAEEYEDAPDAPAPTVRRLRA